MTTTTTSGLLDFADLITEPYEPEFSLENDPSYDFSWTFAHRGIEWWSDRHVILRADIGTGELPDGAVCNRLPEKSTANAQRLISLALDGELASPTQGFSAWLAGPLTKAGMSAQSIAGEDKIHALVRDGRVVGCIMPRSNDRGPDARVTLPVPPDLVRWHDLIEAGWTLSTQREIWDLAEFICRATRTETPCPQNPAKENADA